MRKLFSMDILLTAGVCAGAAYLSGCVPVVVGAATTTGVAVVQERSVGSALDDTAIDANINALMLDESGRLFRKVGVEVLEGRVLLTGSVQNPDDRIKATMVAWRAPGVKEVINELQVSDKKGIVNYTKDAWITTQLRTKILTDSKILDINYSVETVNGVIYLLGIAQSQAELDKVTGYARNISGVERVVSYVRTPGASATQAPISQPPAQPYGGATPAQSDDPNSDLVTQEPVK